MIISHPFHKTRNLTMKPIKHVISFFIWIVFTSPVFPTVTVASSHSGVHLLKSWASYYSCVLHLLSFKDRQAHAEFFGHGRSGMGPTVLQNNHSSFLTRKIVQYHQTKRSGCTFTCVMFLLFSGDNSSVIPSLTKEDLSLVLEQLQNSVFLHVNPRFVTFAIPTIQERDVNLDIFLTTLPLIHISTVYLVVSKDSHNIHLVCQYCTSVGGIIKKLKNVRGVTEMYQEWLKLHRNLSLTPVSIKRNELNGFAGTTRHHCDSLGMKFFGEKKLCSFKWMEKFLNFKAEFTPTKISQESSASSVYADRLLHDYTITLPAIPNLIDVDNFQVIMVYRYAKEKPNTRLEWIPHVWHVNPISFALVLDKSTLSRSALAKPFDQETWLLTFISWMSVSSALVLCLWIHDVRSRNYDAANNPLFLSKKLHPDAIKMMMITLGSIIEQNPSDLTIKKAIISFQVLFGTWLLISLVLSNAYTGIIISFLCSDITPQNLPNSFQELINFTHFPIITADTVFVSEHNKMIAVLPGLIREFVELANRSAFRTVTDDYTKLNFSILCLSRTTKSKLIYLYDKGISIPKDEISINRSYKLPVEFVYGSLNSYVTRFAKIMKRNPHVTIWQPPPNDFIRVIQAFSVTRNYFSILFKKYSYFITEAGFLTIWGRKEQERYYKQDLERYNNLTKCDDSKIWSDQKCLPVRNETSDDVTSSEFDEYEDTKPLALPILYSPFMLFFSGLAVAVLIMLLEIISRISRQDKVFSIGIDYMGVRRKFKAVSNDAMSIDFKTLNSKTFLEKTSQNIDMQMLSGTSASIPGRLSSQTSLKYL